MSVIRHPGVLGQRTRRRLVKLAAALTVAVVEALAVSLWFGLVITARSTTTALIGLGILLCGSLLRITIFEAAITDSAPPLTLERVGTALTLTAGWVVWLLLAELLGGATGVLVATVCLTGALTAQFCFECYVFHSVTPTTSSVTPVLSAAVLALGAATLLTTAWFVDWTIGSPLAELDAGIIAIRIETIQLAALVFGLCAFLAHQHRFQRLLEPDL
ncbi:hypothetical protein [Natrialba taiwanensis]|uniref:Uncharacterized protein n=1 Tax=Natrialba taiwanensis DSM 12281 TaxID=1230458 RepID=L9ZW86_9EURY|nr:hypothetical protein [Natrialba taiwanensis]ELY90750.1 hypothetical protein C484_11021 [Natrialba taiwanensis DSM 12281]